MFSLFGMRRGRIYMHPWDFEIQKAGFRLLGMVGESPSTSRNFAHPIDQEKSRPSRLPHVSFIPPVDNKIFML